MVSREREDNIYYARLAEQGERYEDMIRYMKEVAAVSPPSPTPHWPSSCAGSRLVPRAQCQFLNDPSAIQLRAEKKLLANQLVCADGTTFERGAELAVSGVQELGGEPARCVENDQRDSEPRGVQGQQAHRADQPVPQDD